MIPNHAQFVAALQEQKKVRLKFYSKADSGVVDRVCAPMAYGPGGEINDGLNRYWLWDCSNDKGVQALSLLPQQIVDLQVLGEVFDPADFTSAPTPVASVAQAAALPPAPVASDGGAPTPGL